MHNPPSARNRGCSLPDEIPRDDFGCAELAPILLEMRTPPVIVDGTPMRIEEVP